MVMFMAMYSLTPPKVSESIPNEPEQKPKIKELRKVSQDRLKVLNAYPTQKVKVMKTDSISKTANRFYQDRFRSIKSSLDIFMSHPGHTPESLNISEAVSKMFGTPEQAIDLYIQEIEASFTQDEITALNDIQSSPLVSKFSEIPDEFDSKDYSEFTHGFVPSEKRDALVSDYLTKIHATEHAMKISEATSKVTSQFSKQPQITPETLSQMRVAMDQVGKTAMHFKLRHFSDEELESLVRVKSLPIAIKEESIKQKVLMDQINAVVD